MKTNQPVYQPRQGRDEAGNPVTFYEVVYTLRADRYGREEVEVYDMRRNKLDTNDLAKLLNKEIAALVLAGTREIDPLHLRLIKEGTLIFVLPLRGIPAPRGFRLSSGRKGTMSASPFRTTAEASATGTNPDMRGWE